MQNCKIKLLSSLAKVFGDEEPSCGYEDLKFTVLKNDRVSFQTAIYLELTQRRSIHVDIISPIRDLITVRKVESVPVRTADTGVTDDNYLRKGPGMYPDLLLESKDHTFRIRCKEWQSFWIDVETDASSVPGEYEIIVRFTSGEDLIGEIKTKVTIYDAVLPPLSIDHTEWLHCDCLADYYHVIPWSEEHFKIVGNFIDQYVARDGNMLLTPIFTPSLDVAIDGPPRTCVQLVEIEKTKDTWKFDFTNFRRFIKMADEKGIKTFEMAHLFSQWGAKYAPRIMGYEDGVYKELFGFSTPAVGEYTKFLECFIPALIQQIDDLGIRKRVIFHISDEPGSHLESFKVAKTSIEKLLEGFHTLDAISYYDVYKEGLLDRPVPGNDEIEPFLEHKVPNLWTYYCVKECVDVSNRFMSMPSARNRIYGLQLFRYDIVGTLHWGYNFYNTALSLEHIDPFSVTDAGGVFPAGDAFLVYPGKDEKPLESIRQMVFSDAMGDHRALTMLAKKIGKDKVIDLMEEDLPEPITFKKYPRSDFYLLNLRNRVNKMIADH